MGNRLLTMLFLLGPIPVGMWLFGYFPVSPPKWLTEGPDFDPLIALPAVARTLYLGLLTFVSLVFFNWIGSVYLTRRFSMRDTFEIMWLSLQSRWGSLFLLISAINFGSSVTQVISVGAPLDSYVVRISLAMIGGILLIMVRPPAALFLARSSPSSGRLIETIRAHFWPYRVVMLLNDKQLTPIAAGTKYDNFRTLFGRRWRKTVCRLIDITPLIVIDVRTATSAVCEEVEYILNTNRVAKAIFVINDDGSAPGLEIASNLARKNDTLRCYASDLTQILLSFKRSGNLGIKMFDLYFDSFEWSPMGCVECGRKLKVLIHKEYGLGPVPIDRQIMELMDKGIVKEGVYCVQCKRCYCFSCSRIDRQCECGSRAWGNSVYMKN